MALVTNQQLSQFYDLYKEIDVTFNKQVTRAINLLTKQSFLRFLGNQLPCIVYSSSMVGAKVLAKVSKAHYAKIREANNLVSLRFCFHLPDKIDPISFFVSGKITGFSKYNADHPDLTFVTIDYTQRPSDDLIAILGQLLEANINSKKRREERIEINTETLRKLSILSREVVLHVSDVPRKGILRDISFSGAKVFVPGVSKFLLEKPAKLKVEFDGGKETHLIAGTIVRFDQFPEQKGIGAAGIQFDESHVPMEYRMRLNDYLKTVRKTTE